MPFKFPASHSCLRRLTKSTSNSWKSCVFRVATAKRCPLAVAAIMASSITVPDLPCLRRAHSWKRPHPSAETVTCHDPAEPSLQLSRSCPVSLACEFHAGLKFSDSHRWQKQPVGRYLPDPVQHRPVRLGTAEFRHDIGVEKIHSVMQVPTPGDGHAASESPGDHLYGLPARATVPSDRVAPYSATLATAR